MGRDYPRFRTYFVTSSVKNSTNTKKTLKIELSQSQPYTRFPSQKYKAEFDQAFYWKIESQRLRERSFCKGESHH
jgi:hypothetical protein